MSESFGERLKELRKAAGLTQSQFSEKLGVHLQTVSKWERGVTEPDLSLLGEMAAVLGVSLEKLIGAEEGPETFTGNFSPVSFGRALAAARKGRGENQEALAVLLDTAPDIVSKWERGVVCPDVRQLLLLSGHFGMPVSRLYFGICEDTRTETPVQARRRRRFSLAVAGAGAAVCLALACFSFLLPHASAAEQPVYTVIVEGTSYEVGSEDWFAPEVPFREGYELLGYVDSSGDPVSFPVKVTEDEQYTAIFSPREYEIDYWLNGGMLLSDAPFTFTMESGTLELPVPQKQGSSFEGWYLSPDYSGSPVEHVACACADISLFAKWSNTVYTLRYELGGGALMEENPSEVTSEKEVRLSEPVRRGYHFLGWYDGPAGGRRYEYVGGENARNLTLYALWQESGDLCSVIYHTEGGTLLGDNPVSVGAGEVHVLAGAQKTGYDFVGWNTSADGSGTWYGALRGIREDLELYAVYAPKSYTVIYELDNGSYYKGENPNEIVFGQEVKLNPVAKAGHTFLGWYDAEEGGREVKEINASNILTLRRLWARFEANEYKIRLYAAGGSFLIGEESCSSFIYTAVYGDTFMLPSCTLAGYDFLGWYDEEGALYEKIDELNIGDLSLTARYRPAGQTYEISYVLNGGTQAAGNPETVAAGQVIYLSDPVREGYRFLGWNDAPDGSGNCYDATPADREEDLTLYAIWQEYTVSGSDRDFTYEMGQASVTVTGYTGSFGESVDLVIPSYIQGRPVVAVENIAPEFDGHKFPLHSLTLPDTVRRLGARAFKAVSVELPVVIPAGVTEIGQSCFASAELSLSFGEGSELSALGEGAFRGARLKNVVVLPEGLQRLEVNTFSGASLSGVVLPETLRYISGGALGAQGGSATSNDSFSVYIPASVEYIESYAFSGGCDYKYVYLSSEEQAEKFSPDWASSRNGVTAQVSFVSAQIGGVTLDYGDRTEFLEGHAFALPSLQKEGYTFLGWYDAETDFVNPLYIPQREGVVLGAVFEEQTDTDGRSAATRAVLEAGQEYEFLLLPYGELYFLPDAGSGKIRITLQMSALGCPGGITGKKLTVFSDPYGNPVSEGVTISYREGDIFCLKAYPGGNYHFRVKIRIDVIA